MVTIPTHLHTWVVSAANLISDSTFSRIPRKGHHHTVVTGGWCGYRRGKSVQTIRTPPPNQPPPIGVHASSHQNGWREERSRLATAIMNDDTARLPTTQQTIINALTQPMTVTQLAKRAELGRDVCSRQLRKLAEHGRVCCLTPTAQRSRVYATREHASARQEVCWDLYAWICFSHRSAVLRALDQPLQPAEIARRARRRDPQLRMSANNVRDVIAAFRTRGVVRPHIVKKKAHPRYELTPTGRQLQQLLLAAETPRSAQ